MGSLFSGLFLSIKDIDPAVRPLTTVRVPATALRQPRAPPTCGSPCGPLPAASKSTKYQCRQHRHWEDSQYLAARIKAAEKRIKVGAAVC